MSERIEFKRTSRRPRLVGSDTLVVTQASIRLAFWPDVAVKTVSQAALTTLELFVLECAITMGTLRPEHFETITGLPRDLLHPLARRLVNAGAVAKEGTRYVIKPQSAAYVLEKQAVARLTEAKRSFLCLPGTGDIIALSSKDIQTMNDLEKRDEYRSVLVPAPRHLSQISRPELLGQHIRQGTVYGLGEEVVDVSTHADGGDLAFPEGSCPAYTCSALVRRVDNSVQVILTFNPTSSASTTRPLTIELPGPTNLGEAWLTTADAPSKADHHRSLWRALAPSAPATPRISPKKPSVGKWQLHLDGLCAESLARTKQNLAVEAAVDVTDSESSIELGICFVAADKHAERLISLDRAILEAHADGDDPEPLQDHLRRCTPTDPRMPQLTTFDDVLARLWELRRFQLAYAMTEQQDLRYD